MVSSKRYNGLSVDIWSSGVILFAMVCGYLPFEDSNTSKLYKKILAGEYILPDDVSSQFQDIINKILTIDPTQRYHI
jgi:5'-AMP-activated protein kinase catalytic alpha subunit